MDILAHYLAAVARFGGSTFGADDEDVVKKYRKAAMAGMGWVLTPYQMPRKERVITICERYCAAIVDHKAIELVESLPNIQ